MSRCRVSSHMQMAPLTCTLSERMRPSCTASGRGGRLSGGACACAQAASNQAGCSSAGAAAPAGRALHDAARQGWMRGRQPRQAQCPRRSPTCGISTVECSRPRMCGGMPSFSRPSTNTVWSGKVKSCQGGQGTARGGTRGVTPPRASCQQHKTKACWTAAKQGSGTQGSVAGRQSGRGMCVCVCVLGHIVVVWHGTPAGVGQPRKRRLLPPAARAATHSSRRFLPHAPAAARTPPSAPGPPASSQPPPAPAARRPAPSLHRASKGAWGLGGGPTQCRRYEERHTHARQGQAHSWRGGAAVAGRAPGAWQAGLHPSPVSTRWVCTSSLAAAGIRLLSGAHQTTRDLGATLAASCLAPRTGGSSGAR